MHCKEANLLQPPSLTPQGPKAGPSPEADLLGPRDLQFLLEHSRPTLRGPSAQTGPVDQRPAEFSPLGHLDFSGFQALSGKGDTIMECDPPPSGNWPALYGRYKAIKAHKGLIRPFKGLISDPPPNGNWPRAPRSLPSHAVCSQHVRGGSWSIASFCQECDRIAVNALAYQT